MQACWNDESDWDAGQGSPDRQETVQIIVHDQCNQARESNDNCPRQVFAHLPLARLVPAFEEPGLDDEVDGVDDEGVRKDQV